MNGAQSLIRTLVNCGVDVCFGNPGTSEMHFVAALDSVPEMRPVLCLFEGVATGAADGYARMADKPAAVLLHLGPGLANGLACLHNARRASVPVVNIVGDHATYHLQYDAPLTSDIAGFARPVSSWVHSIKRGVVHMAARVHGHEVMEMMVASGKSYTRESLRADMVTRFGPDTRFYTCSADSMTPDELISFLEARGKFVPVSDGFTTDPSKLCNH